MTAWFMERSAHKPLPELIPPFSFAQQNMAGLGSGGGVL
jgi:hypothetical protein